jgi:hypothetical protein
MANPYVQTITQDGQLVFGNAINSGQTDAVDVSGQDDVIFGIGGNIDVYGASFPPGGDPTDSDTAIDLTISNGAITGVTDTFVLDGEGNYLTNLNINTNGYYAIKNSVVTATVNGNGGFNTVDLEKLSNSTVTVNIGVDATATAPEGNNTVTIFNKNGSNQVDVGGPANTIDLIGAVNTVTSGGGVVTLNGNAINEVSVTSDGAIVTIGAPGDHDSSYSSFVTLTGTGDILTGGDENFVVLGTGVTSDATISLGNGNNMIILGGAGGNIVTVGNGGDSISATGSNSTYNLGDGANSLTLSSPGDGNTINVTDPKGVGNDFVQLGGDTNSIVNLDHAAGSVSGTARTGVTIVNQAGKNAVTVNLGGGVGDITLGNGADTVTANGDGTVITLGNGRDTVTARGANDTFTFGNGNDSLTANGNNDKGTFGTAGAGGNDTLVANGSGDAWTFNEKSTSTVTATLGANDTLTQTGGALNATLQGAGDTLNLTNVQTTGTTIDVNGNDETLNFTNSGGNLALNPAAVGDTLTIAGVSNKFAGTITISGLGSGDTVNLDDLYTTGGAHITSSNFAFDLKGTPTGEVLNLQGGGEIKFAAGTALSLSQFHFA